MVKALYSLSFLGWWLVSAHATVLPSSQKWDWNLVETIPIQHGGRIKPLSSFAIEAVIATSGSRSYKQFRPTEMLFSWMLHPKDWMEEPFIKISHPEVKKQLLLDPQKNYYSPAELARNDVFKQYLSEKRAQVAAVTEKAPETKARELDLRRALDAILIFDSVLFGESLSIIPNTQNQDPHAKWHSMTFDHPLRKQFALVLKAYGDNNAGQFKSEAMRFRDEVSGLIPDFKTKIEPNLKREQWLNCLRPFRWAWIFYLLAGILFFLSIHKRPYGLFSSNVLGKILLGLGLFSHLGGFILRILVAGRPPVSNMYESVIWVSFGVVLFGSIIYLRTKESGALTAAAWMSAFLLLVGDSVPAVLDPTIQPLVPVLRSNLWLTVHVLTITLGYAAFGLAFAIGLASLYQFTRTRSLASWGLLVEKLNALIYRAIQFGVVLLAAGTILGGVWADYSWGRFWGWDPKEVWALIALLVYVVILHGRFVGWVNVFTFPAYSVLGFLFVVMAWYGVNFVLGAGLHSYGFSAGGTPYVAGFCLLMVAYVITVAIMRKKQKA